MLKKNKHKNNLARLFLFFEVIFLPREVISKKSPQKILRVLEELQGNPSRTYRSGPGPPSEPLSRDLIWARFLARLDLIWT